MLNHVVHDLLLDKKVVQIGRQMQIIATAADIIAIRHLLFFKRKKHECSEDHRTSVMITAASHRLKNIERSRSGEGSFYQKATLFVGIAKNGGTYVISRLQNSVAMLQ